MENGGRIGHSLFLCYYSNEKTLSKDTSGHNVQKWEG